MHLKCGEESLKTLMMHYCEDCEFLLDCVAVAWRPFGVIRHETGSCCNFSVLCQICSKYVSHDDGPGLRSFGIVMICQTDNTETDAVILFCSSNVAFTFRYVQNQARVLVRVEVEHVTQAAVCESRTEHWDVILKQNIIRHI